MSWAFVTGASSGIGYEFAKVIAEDGYDVFLVARRADRLETLKQEIESETGKQAIVIVADLEKGPECLRAYEETKKHTNHVEILINNAGFGYHQDFHEAPIEKGIGMVDLNVRALTQLSHLFLQDMVRENLGYICNVASTAAFQAGPGMAVYFASKAYVLSFTEAIADELADKNVFASALCPGPTQSEFGKAANFNPSKVAGRSSKFPTSREVAEYGYKAMKEGRPSVIHGTFNAIMAQTNRFVPRALATQVTGKMIRQF